MGYKSLRKVKEKEYWIKENTSVLRLFIKNCNQTYVAQIFIYNGILTTQIMAYSVENVNQFQMSGADHFPKNHRFLLRDLLIL